MGCISEVGLTYGPETTVLFNEILSGFSDDSMAGTAWIPLDDPASYCESSGAVFTFVSLQDPLFAMKVSSLLAREMIPCVSVDGPLARLAEEIGWTEALMLTEMRGASAEFARLEEKCLSDVFVAAEAGAGCIVVADDIAGEAGPLVSWRFAARTLLPVYTRMAENSQARALPAVFHSDGDVEPLLEGLAEGGFSGVHVAVGTRPGAIEEVFASIRSFDLVPVGGIAAAELLDGDAQHMEAVERVRRILDSGPTLLCDDGGLATVEELTALSRLYSLL